MLIYSLQDVIFENNSLDRVWLGFYFVRTSFSINQGIGHGIEHNTTNVGRSITIENVRLKRTVENLDYLEQTEDL